MLRSERFWTGFVAAHGARVIRRSVLGGLLGCLLLALGVSTASAVPSSGLEDFSGPAFQILAPGEEGNLPTNEFSTDQGKLYNALTPLGGHVSTKAIERDYLSEKFGVVGPVIRTEKTGRAGLEILRDSHDIPHIFGKTRADVMFGSGWVAAEDRGLLLRLGLGPAYAAADGIPGISPFQLLLSARGFTPSAQSIEFVNEQQKVLLEQGAEGEQVLHDLENWVKGVNAFEKTLPPFARIPTATVGDAIAGFSLIGSIFGNGGGNEVTNSGFLARLQAKLGAKPGTNVFRDLREVNDPEAATTISTAFPYDQQPTGPTPGAAVIDPGSMSSSAVAASTASRESKRQASNFLLVGGANTRSGHPMAVMGPQLGYFYPEIVMQADLHGPGVDAEGIVAPIAPYVFIGRGRDFAWSLTSADSENTQQFLEQLCNSDGSKPTRESTSYVHDGECVPMKFFDAGTLEARDPEPERELTFYETVHGPVSGTVTVKGKPYAIANDRSTRGREPAGELAFSALDSDRVHSPGGFFEAADKLETTFNMAYLDSRSTAYFSTGRLPILAPGTDPSLPTLGTGEFDWQGFLSLAQHPHEVVPEKNILLSWNNKPAPQWGAASGTFSYGPVQRVQLYTGFHAGMTESDDVSIMNGAALQDLRALKVWPVIEQVLAGGPAPSKLAEQAAGLITKWVEEGASRGGRNKPKNPGAAVMDAVWTPIAEAVLGPVLGELMPEFESINGPDNAPNSLGSAFDGGWYGYVYKDLRSQLGLPVEGPFSRGYCGNGSLEACRASLWAVIQAAAEQLEASQGPELAAWRAAPVRITFPPGLLPKFTMRWTNRSTFQQVIEFSGHDETSVK
jgi:acyl-homoserine lactone acylase PvdQ